jgi:hypothetical protein
MVFVIVLVSWISPPVFLGIHVIALVPVREAGGDTVKRTKKSRNFKPHSLILDPTTGGI